MTSMILIALFATALAAGPAEVLDGLPNTDVETYPVRGDTRAEVRRSMQESRPVDVDGRPYDGVTAWTYSYNVMTNARGDCLPDSVRVSYRITVTLPGLARRGRLSAYDLSLWNAYVDGLARHERNHVAIVMEGAGRLERALRRAECGAGMEAAADRVQAEIDAESRDYDARTRHGALEIPSFG